MKIQDVFNLLQEKTEMESKLFSLKEKCSEALKKLIAEYFNGEIPKYLPIKKNQFISVYNNSFTLQKGEKGIFWIAKGRLVTVKDGNVTYGHSEKSLYQGEYESLSPAVKNSTVESAKTDSVAVFPIAPRVFCGTDFANYGYELANNTDLGIVLVWRKGATAYLDRAHGSATSEAALQILMNERSPIKYEERIRKIKNFVDSPNISAKTKELVERVVRMRYLEVETGGRFSKNVILKHQDFIQELFGNDVVNDIVMKLDSKKTKGKVVESESAEKPKNRKV